MARFTALHINNGKILNADNVAIQLTGVVDGFAHWGPLTNTRAFDTPINTAYCQALVNFGCNVYRIQLNEDIWLNKNSPAYGGTNFQNDVIAAVNTLTANNIYVILNFQGSTADSTNNVYGMPTNATPNGSQAMWTQVIQAFASNQYVIFDIINEPHGAITWSQLVSGGTDSGGKTFVGTQTMLNIVRTNESVTHLCMTPGLSFTADLSQWLTHLPTDTASNALMASWHLYTNTNNWPASYPQTWFSYGVPIANAGYPIVVGEMGYQTPALDTTYLDTLCRFMDSINGHYLMYSWYPYPPLNAISDYTGKPETVSIPYKWHLQQLKNGYVHANTGNSRNPVFPQLP